MKQSLLVGCCLFLLTPSLTYSATDYSATIRELSPYITNQLQATGASSLALVLVDGTQVVWAEGFGLADPLEGRKANADTIYGIASVSKTFTALAAFRQVDRGKLDLDTPVTNYVPTFGFKARFPGAALITPRLLMNHQSGLPGDYIPYAQTTVPDPRFGVEVLEGLADEYPVWPPNFSDTYNNNGFTLMESVVAALSGTTFVAQAAADVFQPLEMTNTAFQTVANMFGDKLARSMIGTNSYPDEIVNVHASGGIYSSANDMGRALEMLLGNGLFRGRRFLDTNSLAAMLTFQGTNTAIASSDPNTRNGLGWDNVADPALAYAGRACYKGGDSACFHSHLEFMPEHGLGVAVLANGGAPSMNVGQRALMLALRDKFGLPLPTNSAPFPDSPAVTNPPLPWDRLAGYYTREAGLILITATNASLSLNMYPFTSPTPTATNLTPHANGWFWTVGNTNAQIAFSNVAGHFFLMVKNNKGRYWNTQMMGERISPATLSTAWMQRAQTAWIAADLDPFNFSWAQNDVKPATFMATNGFLFFCDVAFGPTHDDLALPFIAGRNDGGSLKAAVTNGEERLKFMGNHFRPVETLPVLSAPGATNTALSGDIIGWYRIPRSGSGRLELNLAGTPLPQLRVLNSAFSLLAGLQPVAGRLLVAPTGAVYAAVTRSLAGGRAYALSALWRRVAADYDGDGKADPVVYDPAQAIWGVSLSASGYTQTGSLIVGRPDQIPAAEDYDGDGKMDPAAYRAADGLWTVYFSGNNYTATTLSEFGTVDATPVPADYDGDGKADPACYRTADGTWGFRLSSDNYATTLLVNGFGGPGWTPVSADYDGDGKTDPAIYRAADGIWSVGLSGSDYTVSTLDGFGAVGAIPVPADYDGDGKADLACYRAADGAWGFRLSSDNYATTLLVNGFGGPDCAPVPADFDGDGKADPALYRQADGLWGCMLSASDYAVQTHTFGGEGYDPVGIGSD